MPVLGVQFKAFEARRYQDAPPKQQVRVDHNSSLSAVQKNDDGKVRIDFAFTTSYGALGMVKIEGALLWTGDDPDGLVAAWSKDRNLPPELAQEIHSAILGACVPEAVLLSKDLRMPPPIPLPQVRFQGKQATASTEPGPDAA